MVTVNAHFDGKTIVVDEPLPLPLRAGARLRLLVEAVDEVPPQASSARAFRPLNIKIDSALSNAIALGRQS